MAMGSPASPRNVGAVQPPRAARLLHTRRTLSKPTASLPPTVAFSSYAPSPPSSSRLPLLGITLFAFPAAGRRASSCATLLAYTLLALPPPYVRAYIDRMLDPLPLAYRSLPRCMPRCIPPLPRASRVSLATTESVGLQRVFSTSRGEPRSLRLTRADFRAALIALGGRVRHAWISQS